MNKTEIANLYNGLLAQGLGQEQASKITVEILIDDVPDGLVTLTHAANMLGIAENLLCRHVCYQHLNSVILEGVTQPCFRRSDLETFTTTYPSYKTPLA